MAATYIKSRVPISTYAKRMNRLSKRIFNDVPWTVDESSKKVSAYFQEMPREEDEFFKVYYPPHPMLLHLSKLLRLHGLFRDEHQDFKDEMDRLRDMRGKRRPAIGQGKTALLKQGKA